MNWEIRMALLESYGYRLQSINLVSPNGVELTITPELWIDEIAFKRRLEIWIRENAPPTEPPKKKSPWPKSLQELREAGYLRNSTGTCGGCPATIIWFITPAGKKQPMEYDPYTKAYSPHHATCPAANLYRKGKAKK